MNTFRREIDFMNKYNKYTGQEIDNFYYDEVNDRMVYPRWESGNINKCFFNAEIFTYMHFATVASDINEVQRLLNNGASINIKTDYNSNCLHLCMSAKMVKMLYPLIPDYINECDKEGYTPLLAACLRGHLDVVKELVRCGADINKKFNQNRYDYQIRYDYTPIEMALKYRHKDIADFLSEVSRICCIV